MTRDIGETGSNHLWRPAGLPDVLLLRANYDRQRFSRHFHDEFVIGVNVAGAHAFECRGARHPVPTGAIALVDPGDVHTGEVMGDAGWRYRSLFVAPAMVRDAWESIGGSGDPSFAFSCVSNAGLARRIVGVHRALERRDPGIEDESALLEILGELLCRYGSGARSNAPGETSARMLDEVRDRLDEQLVRPPSLGELATRAGVGRFQLLRSFRRRFGLAPHQYVTARRVAEARRLIESGLPLSTAAAHAGFADQSHMNRHFRRFAGFTPGQLRSATGQRAGARPRYSATA